MTGSDERTYLPALRFDALTRVYDPLVRFTTRERAFKRRLLEQAQIADGHSVLDLGCGTGTLALMASEARPGARVRGLDADPAMLGRARRKAAEANAEIDFEEGYSTELPFDDGSFDRVVSSLFFHHLDPVAKDTTAEEVMRVLKPSGELHVADWGAQPDPVMRAAFLLTVQALDGLETTRDNAFGRLPEIFEGAGLEDAREVSRMRTPFGSMSFYRASSPGAAA